MWEDDSEYERQYDENIQKELDYYKPENRAIRLRNRLEELVSETKSKGTFRYANNKYNISIEGYRYGYSVCGFICTQIIDIVKKPYIIDHPVISKVQDNSNEILAFIEAAIRNDFSNIAPPKLIN